MQSKATKKFWKCYLNLPEPIQKTALKQYNLWIRDPAHSSLQFKKINDAWSCRVTDNYRALGVKSGDTVIWFWIGAHGEYETLIRRKN
jgi:hypothetical protein